MTNFLHPWLEGILLTLLAVAVLPYLSRLVLLRACRGRWGCGNRGFVEICPGYRSLLRRLGLTEPEHFLSLPSVTVSGHPDRNVSRVVLGQGATALTAFLKREHVVSWRARWHNILAGFGWVSRSLRECRVLQALEREGLPCPDWLAAGEDNQGRAFLLLREHEGCIELRCQLQQDHDPASRGRLAVLLGQGLARLHHNGFTHPDLYANHVLLQPTSHGLVLLDWQRTRRRKRVSWRQRGRDLAALHVTLPGNLASPRERWRCLRAYLIEARKLAQYSDGKWPRHRVLHSQQCQVLLASLELAGQRRLQRRHVLEKRQQGLVRVSQTWHRLDGEALCVTSSLARTCPERDPNWLALDQQPAPFRSRVARRWLPLPGWRRARLERQAGWLPLALLARWMHRPRWASRETRRAGLLLRLERHGIIGPSILAKGQVIRRSGWVDAFLLTEPASDALRLDLWLQRQARSQSDQSAWQRREVLRLTGALLARMHQACCYLTRAATIGLLAVQISAEPHRVLLQDIDGIKSARAPRLSRSCRDHARLRRWLFEAGCGPDDLGHMDAGYRQHLSGRDALILKEATCRA